jgi:hypothetical protein
VQIPLFDLNVSFSWGLAADFQGRDRDTLVVEQPLLALNLKTIGAA